MSEAAIPNYEQEIDLCSKAMLIDPKEPQHPINRASCWLQLKEWRKVILDCDLALEMGIEKSEKVYFWKAKAHFFLNQYTDALQNVLEARKMQKKLRNFRGLKCNSREDILCCIAFPVRER